MAKIKKQNVKNLDIKDNSKEITSIKSISDNNLDPIAEELSNQLDSNNSMVKQNTLKGRKSSRNKGSLFNNKTDKSSDDMYLNNSFTSYSNKSDVKKNIKGNADYTIEFSDLNDEEVKMNDLFANQLGDLRKVINNNPHKFNDLNSEESMSITYKDNIFSVNNNDLSRTIFEFGISRQNSILENSKIKNSLGSRVDINKDETILSPVQGSSFVKKKKIKNKSNRLLTKRSSEINENPSFASNNNNLLRSNSNLKENIISKREVENNNNDTKNNNLMDNISNKSVESDKNQVKESYNEPTTHIFNHINYYNSTDFEELKETGKFHTANTFKNSNPNINITPYNKNIYTSFDNAKKLREENNITSSLFKKKNIKNDDLLYIKVKKSDEGEDTFLITNTKFKIRSCALNK